MQKIDATETGLIVQFVPNPPIDPMKIIKLIQTKRQFKLAGPDRLKYEKNKLDAVKDRIGAIKEWCANSADHDIYTLNHRGRREHKDSTEN